MNSDRRQMAALAAGGAIILLGLAGLSGWAFGIDSLKTLSPGLVTMKANTALLFAAAGAAIVLQSRAVTPRSTHIARAGAIFILAVALVTLVQRVTNTDLGIDQLLFPDPDTPLEMHPGRMSLASNIAFLLVGAVLYLNSIAAHARQLAALARGLTLGVLGIGLFSLVGYWIQLDTLYAVYQTIALHTAIGFVVTGIGLWACGQTYWPRDRVLSEDERITRTAAVILVIAAGATGIAGFGVLEAEVQRSYGQGQQVALEARVVQITTNIALRTDRTRIITTRPNLLKHLRLLTADPANGESLQVVRGVLDSFTPHDFTAIVITSVAGAEVTRVGEFITAPELTTELNGSGDSQLLWQEGVYLRNRLPLRDQEGELGTVTAEQYLPNLTRALLEPGMAGETSTEFQLCSPAAEVFRCFPTRLSTQPLILPRHSQGSPLLMQLALAESGTGYGVTHDYRRHRVLGAFGPVGTLGLYAVLKADTRDIYRPLTRQLEFALVLVLLLTAAGTWLMRRQVRPLAAALDRRVTELATANAALEASEAQFRLVVEGAPNAMVMVDTSGRIVLVNSETERVFGFRRDELLGQPVEVLIPERFGTAHPGHRSGFFADPSVRRMGSGRDLYGLRKDGTEVPVEIALSPITTAGDLCVLASIADITDRKQAEDQLNSYFTLSLDMLCIAGADGYFKRVNPAFTETLGWSTDEILARPFLEFVHPDDHAATLREVGRLVSAGENVLNFENRYLHRDGSWRVLSWKSAPHAGGLMFAVARDITEQRRLREQLQRKNEELHAQYRRVQEANRLKSEFLANMSHELRTPLNAIIGFSELIHDGKAGQVNAEQKEYLNDILTSAQHLLQLINDVLDLAKVEAGKLEFHAEPVELAAVIGEVCVVLRALMAQKRINVDSHVDAALSGITADPGKLKQVLYNYLSNAIKFTTEGGRVAIRALPAGPESYRIEVEDSGVGIREEDMPRLFAEFQQLDAGATKKYQGTGLGLALTRRIVEAQGGEVGARSIFGKGSTFYVVLPRRLPGAADTQIPPGARAPQDAPLLLLIEDNREDLAWLSQVLAEAGYRTETATEGRQAIARCREQAYDAIILDILLPDISGWEVLKDSQNGGPNQATPVIVVSVLNDPAKGRAQVQAFLTKPVTREALLESLARAGIHPGAGNRILIVDDDPLALKLAETMLGELGYGVLTASNGEQGLALLRQQHPDAVVLDLLMPGMSGFEFLEHAHNSDADSRAPVVVWTVKDLTAEEHRQLHTRVHAVVAKGGRDGIHSLLMTLGRLVPPKPHHAPEHGQEN